MQLRSVDKQRLDGSYDVISDETMERVEEALKIVTGLTRIEHKP
jgi:mRNA-degrading endonuclease toxin of MazEF toxin-antitoxin module